LKLGNKIVYKNLDKLFERSPTIELKQNHKWVVFSDLHMGDGGSTDDFKPNADLFTEALNQHYYMSNYGLLLNGDVEELQRFSLKKIIDKWQSVYEIFN